MNAPVALERQATFAHVRRLDGDTLADPHASDQLLLALVRSVDLPDAFGEEPLALVRVTPKRRADKPVDIGRGPGRIGDHIFRSLDLRHVHRAQPLSGLCQKPHKRIVVEVVDRHALGARCSALEEAGQCRPSSKRNLVVERRQAAKTLRYDRPRPTGSSGKLRVGDGLERAVGPSRRAAADGDENRRSIRSEMDDDVVALARRGRSGLRIKPDPRRLCLQPCSIPPLDFEVGAERPESLPEAVADVSEVCRDRLAYQPPAFLHRFGVGCRIERLQLADPPE